MLPKTYSSSEPHQPLTNPLMRSGPLGFNHVSPTLPHVPHTTNQLATKLLIHDTSLSASILQHGHMGLHQLTTLIRYSKVVV